MNIIEQLLNNISDELNISETMYLKAVESYKHIGNYLKSSIGIEEKLIEVYPQGSFNLGTVIKPINDEDDGYDIDLVIEIYNLLMSAKETKITVGRPLYEHGVYAKKIEEGKRCWTLSYDGFHMDILPSLTNIPFDDEIKITHKNNTNNYEFKTSNPKGYKKWFDGKNKQSLIHERKTIAKEFNLKVEEVPEYKVRTTLQKSIQILKRHRDLMFQGQEDAPISIIITTLATQSFDGRNDLDKALTNIILNMKNHIDTSSGTGIVLNPVNPNENFADKWVENKDKEQNFYKWLHRLEHDFIYHPTNLLGIDNLINHYKKILGEKPVKKAANKIGDNVLDLRKSDKLYIDKDSKNITVKSDKNTSIPKHTFFGGK